MAAIRRVLRSGMIAQGPEVAAFENEFAELVEGRHCIAVNSGTSALLASLIGLGIGEGDEVIVPSFTFGATANAIVLAGATPVFADVESETFTLDPAETERAITSLTAAVMPVHLYGHTADMSAIVRIARHHGLAIVEDAAQAHLASWEGRPAGCFGDAAAFSFYPTKNMTTGEGGMVVTESDDVARKVRLLRNQGMEIRHMTEIPGLNMRMTDIQAAIGRVQLGALEERTHKRRENAKRLSLNLTGVDPPVEKAEACHVYHQYTVRVPGHQRDDLARFLGGIGIETGVYYSTPVHRLPAYAIDVDLPATDTAASQVLSLPVNPALRTKDLERIVTGVALFMELL